MTEPQAPVFPADAPQDVKDFFDCRGDRLVWRSGPVTWLGLGIDPDVTFEHGATPGSVNITVTIGLPPFGLSFTLLASVNADGELTVDTGQIPDLSGLSENAPGRQSVDEAVRNINDWFQRNGKKLKPAALRGGAVTLEKIPIMVTAPAVVVPVPVTPEPTPTPATPPPPAGGSTEAPKAGGGWCSLLGMLMALLFIGVIALGGGIGFVFFGGEPPPTSTPIAAASATLEPSPTPTEAPSPTTTTSTTTSSPSPTASPTATPTTFQTPTFTPEPTGPATSPSTSTGIGAFCVRVEHTALGDYVSYLDWFLWWFGPGVDYFELVVLEANNGQPTRLEFDPANGAWYGQLGLHGTGVKTIVSLVAHLTDGSTIDVTEQMINAFGGDEVLVRFPQEDSYGECP